MGSKSKGAGVVGGAASGAAMGSSIMPGWGTAIGAGIGGLMGGMDTSGDSPEQVQQIDPAFMNSLYNQANGTEKTAADVKMKASFDQTLAQQVAAARAQRGVNPALLSRNVARMAQEANAKAAQLGEEGNLRNQEDARSKYLTALGMNQKVQQVNSASNLAASERDDKRQGAWLNQLGGMGATITTAFGKKPGEVTGGGDDVSGPMSTGGLSLSDAPTQSAFATQAPDYTLGANTNVTVPQYNMTGTSDVKAKTKIKAITAAQSRNEPAPQTRQRLATKADDLVVMSDERQKDLIKDESLPQNNNLGMQNQQAAQPAAAPQAPVTPMVAAQTAPTGVPGAAPQAPQAPSSPAPVPANQTALAQANASLAKGGQINDLKMQDMSAIAKPADGPDMATLNFFASEAKRQQRRGFDGNPIESDNQLYNKFINEWQVNNAGAKADYLTKVADANTANAGVTNERAARLAKFYTGTTAVNANDIAQRYAPKTVLNNTAWNAVKGNVPENAGHQVGGLGATLGFAAGGPIGAAYGQLAQNNGLIAQSDERSKTDIKSEAPSVSDNFNPKSFLDKLTAYSYEYKQGMKSNPNAGEGRHLSVMAQDLESAGPVGKSMVKQDASGVKQVDYSKGFGAILAAQVTLNERLKKLEGGGK